MVLILFDDGQLCAHNIRWSILFFLASESKSGVIGGSIVGSCIGVAVLINIVAITIFAYNKLKTKKWQYYNCKSA